MLFIKKKKKFSMLLWHQDTINNQMNDSDMISIIEQVFTQVLFLFHFFFIFIFLKEGEQKDVFRLGARPSF